MNPPARRTHAFGALAAIVCFAVFVPTLRYGFVSDDQILITGNENLTWSRLGRLLGSPLWAVAESGVPEVYRHLAGFWRPVVSLSYLLDKTLYGANPWGFHLTNVLMHTLNVALAYRVFLLIFSTPWQAAALALAFGVHPNNSEVVAAIYGRTDLFASVFLLGALLAYAKRAEPGKRALHLAGFSALLALALGSKEQALLFGLPLGGLHLLPASAGLGLSWRSRRAYWICATVIVALYFVLRARALPDAPELGRTGAPIGDGLVYGLGHVAKLGAATLFPWGSYPRTFEVSFALHLVTLELFACGVVFAAALRASPRAAVFGAAWFTGFVFASVFGASLVYGGELGVLAKRHAHVAMPGLLCLAGLGLFRGQEHWRSTGGLVGALAAGAFSVQTLARNETLRDPLTFWKTQTLELPNHELGHYNLGRELMRRGDCPGAVAAFANAVRIQPSYMGGYAQLNLATCLRRLGDVGAAERVVADALRLFPRHSELERLDGELLETRLELALAAQTKGSFAESLIHLDRIHARRESYRNSRFLSGYAHQKVGALAHAIADYELAARTLPDYPLTFVNLGYALLDQNDAARACTSFERAAELLPEDVNVAWGLGECRRRLETSAPPAVASAPRP